MVVWRTRAMALQKRVVPSAVENGREAAKRFKALGAVSKRFRGWRPQAEVIREVEAVPTCMPAYDVHNRVGGHPISRIALMHGPSNEGKTLVELALLKSFLERGHFAAFADAERSTPAKWVNSLLGEVAQSPGFVALPVKTFEHARDAIRSLCETVADARAKRELPDDVTALVCVDSLRGLVPKAIFDELKKAQEADAAEGKQRGGRFGKKPKGIDGYGGRAAQMKAALLSAWMDECVPLFADTRCALLLIGRETKVEAESGFRVITEDWKEYKVGGGVAPFFMASQVIRVTREYVRVKDSEGKSQVVGERHDLAMYKVKVSGKEDVAQYAYVHTSNGVQAPEGFDRARDVGALSVQLEVVKPHGSWLVRADTGEAIAQGEEQLVKKLRADPALAAELERRCRGMVKS